MISAKSFWIADPLVAEVYWRRDEKVFGGPSVAEHGEKLMNTSRISKILRRIKQTWKQNDMIEPILVGSKRFAVRFMWAAFLLAG